MNYYEFIEAMDVKVLWEKHYRFLKKDYFNIVYDLNGILQRKVIQNPEEEKDFEHWIQAHAYKKPMKSNPEWNPVTCKEQGTIIYVKGDWYILLHTGSVEKVPFEISNNLVIGKDYYFGIEFEVETPIDEECSEYKRVYYICEESKCTKHTEEDIIWKMEVTRKGVSNYVRYLD